MLPLLVWWRMAHHKGFAGGDACAAAAEAPTALRMCSSLLALCAGRL
jgi:hypothetical protein